MEAPANGSTTSRGVWATPFCWFAYVEPRCRSTSKWFDNLVGGLGKRFLLIGLCCGEVGKHLHDAEDAHAREAHIMLTRHVHDCTSSAPGQTLKCREKPGIRKQWSWHDACSTGADARTMARAL